MVTHEDLLYFKNHKYAGPIKSIMGIISEYERGGIPKAEMILIIRACLSMQEHSLCCLVEDSEGNEPNHANTKDIQQHRKIYDEYEAKIKLAACKTHQMNLANLTSDEKK